MNSPHPALTHFYGHSRVHFRESQRDPTRVADILAERVLSLSTVDQVLITYDPGSDLDLLRLLVDATERTGASVTIAGLHARRFPGDQVPESLRAQALSSTVWVELNEMYLEGTEIHLSAEAAGLRRFYSMTGMSVGDLAPIIDVDTKSMIELGQRLADLTTDRKEIHITCANGSDFRASCAGQVAAPDTTWMPLGQTHVSPIESTTAGQLVFDGSMFPPTPPRVLREPVAIAFAGGRARVRSDTAESQQLAKWITEVGSEIDRLCHVSYGYHPAVPHATGRLVNDERVWGSLCVGFGPPMPYLVHTDLTILYPTVELDGELIERDGVYVDGEIRRLAKLLGVPGYE